jgi:hypothetical protein
METASIGIEGVQISMEHQINVKFFIDIADSLREHMQFGSI